MYPRNLIDQRIALWDRFMNVLFMRGIALLPSENPDDALDRTRRVLDSHEKQLTRMAEEDRVGDFRSPAASSGDNAWSLRIELLSDGHVFSEIFPLDQDCPFDDMYDLFRDAYERFNSFQVFLLRPGDQEFPLQLVMDMALSVNPVDQALQELQDVGKVIEMDPAPGASDFQITAALVQGQEALYDFVIQTTKKDPTDYILVEDDECFAPVFVAPVDSMQIDPVQEQLDCLNDSGIDEASLALIQHLLLSDRQ
jgi:hypothetical protein